MLKFESSLGELKIRQTCETKFQLGTSRLFSYDDINLQPHIFWSWNSYLYSLLLTFFDEPIFVVEFQEYKHRFSLVRRRAQKLSQKKSTKHTDNINLAIYMTLLKSQRKRAKWTLLKPGWAAMSIVTSSTRSCVLLHADSAQHNSSAVRVQFYCDNS